jgi:hypothetical protein
MEYRRFLLFNAVGAWSGCVDRPTRDICLAGAVAENLTLVIFGIIPAVRSRRHHRSAAAQAQGSAPQ